MKININQYSNPLTHNPKVVGSNPAPATSNSALSPYQGLFAFLGIEFADKTIKLNNLMIYL